MKTRLMLIIKMKITKILKIISNSKKTNQIINSSVITTTRQRAMMINLMTFMTIRDRLKNQRTKSMIRNLIVLFAKSRNIERINV